MKLDVLYEFSDLYAPHAGVSIYSLFDNNQKMDEVTVYILDDGVGEENKIKLFSIAEKYRRTIIFLDTSWIVDLLKKCNVPQYKGSYATYYKLFAMKKLPESIKKILYLDSDTVITSELSELAEYDLEDSPCAMVLDPIFDKYKDILKIGRDKEYFNCGMGLFNVKVWVDQCESQILKLLQFEQSGFFIMEQDIINVLFCEKIKKLPLRYNLTGAFTLYTPDEIYYLYDYKEATMYSKDEIRVAVKNPAICHYIAYQAGRPWEWDNIHPMTPLYDKYLKLTPWKNMRKSAGKYSRLIRIQRELYKRLPRKLYILIHKLILSVTMGKMAKAAERKV